MKTLLALMVVMPLLTISKAWAGDKVTSDIIKTKAGDLKVTFLGHASLIFSFGGKIKLFDVAFMNQIKQRDRLISNILFFPKHEKRTAQF